LAGGEPVPVVLATGNPHKVSEVAAILGPGWHVIAHDVDVEETGETFEENALIKARAAAAATGALVLADDSGIEVDALGGQPGVRSARWVAEGEWIPALLQALDGVPPAARTGRYVCAAAAVWPDGREHVVRATVEGAIAKQPVGAGGFGYDPVMVPAEGDGRTFAEMTAAEKHALSHRGRAFRALLPLLAR
jgi:XTP/dITP diphosphohydrolase